MKSFYLIRLEKAADRQEYLNATVVAKYREEVREAWNAAHPEETL